MEEKILKQTFKVVCDSEHIDATFGPFSPFRLKNDIKDIEDKEVNNIAKCVGEELNNGPGRKTFAKMYVSTKNCKIYYAKIRTEDSDRNKGKSGGYRCIVLVNEIDTIGYILHIYRHKDKDTISSKEKNKLRKLTDEYASSLKYGG